MRRRTNFASMCLLYIAVPAFAGDTCPSGSRQPEEIIKAIRSAPACLASFYVMKDCCSNDVATPDSPRRSSRNKATFLPHMSPGRKCEVCAGKFANRQEAIYASYRATCEAAVAARYAWWWGD